MSQARVERIKEIMRKAEMEVDTAMHNFNLIDSDHTDIQIDAANALNAGIDKIMKYKIDNIPERKQHGKSTSRN